MRTDQRGFDITTAVVVAACVLIAACAGWFLGFGHANDQLPKCQEDEVLSYKDDFPYHHTADLTCVRIDDL